MRRHGYTKADVVGNTDERMDQSFSVFNLHVNDAGKRADQEFQAQYGQSLWEKKIKPFHDEGIMSIFHSKPNIYTAVWVALVTLFVNEDVTHD